MREREREGKVQQRFGSDSFFLFSLFFFTSLFLYIFVLSGQRGGVIIILLSKKYSSDGECVNHCVCVTMDSSDDDCECAC